MKRANIYLGALLLALSCAGEAVAAECTSVSAGDWNDVARWSCGHIPVAADTVVIENNITLDVNPTVAGLTINAGKTLNDNGNGFDITVTGNVVNNGTYGIVGGGDLFMTGADTTISGTGSFIDTELSIDASNITLPAGSTMNFASGAKIEVGENVTPSSFTLAGTITDVEQTPGKTILKVKKDSTATISGTVNAPNSVIDLDKNTTLTNNGTVNVQSLKGKDATSVWTQGANSSLTVTQTPDGKWNGTLNASATGNTVTYGGTANPLTPSDNAYYHLTLSGSGAQTLPTDLTVAGNFTMSGTATTTAPAALTVGGNFIIGTGNTFTPGTGTVTLNGTAAQTIGGTDPVSFNNLTVTNEASPNITLATNVTVEGTLTGTVTLTNTCPTHYTLTSNGGATVVDSCPEPGVSSINTSDADPTTTGASVDWTVTFSESVTGVDATDFALVEGGGATGTSISGVSGSDTTWTVTASTGAGAGTLGLNLVDDDSIINAASNPLGGAGAGNGDFTGEVYTIEFSGAGFVFTDAPCEHNIAFGDPGQTCTQFRWPSQDAGQSSAGVYITAINDSGVPTRLHKKKDRTRDMEFGLSCHDPAANAGVQATFAGVTLPLCQANGATPASWSSTVTVTFPGGSPSSNTSYAFSYADVGRVDLWMRNNAKPKETGNSGTFVVKPGGFLLSAIQQTAAPNLANPGAADASGAKFVKAGEAFSVTVTATTVGGVATPNYGQESSAESVKLTPALVAPVGGSNPAIGGAFGTFTNGVSTGTAFTWDEVGIINLTPSVGDGDYLGMGDVTGTASGNVGRFFPDHFGTAVVATATLPMPCPTGLTCPALYDGFVYSGQPFSVQVTALNLSDGTTTNYDGTFGFSKDATLTAWDAKGGATQNPGSGVLGSNAVAAATFVSGVATLADTPTYTFGTSPTAPTDVYVRAVDADNVTSLRAIPANSVEGGVKVASGRVKIGNAHGSELLDQPMTAIVQYYNGTNWLTSLTDSVTSLTLGLSNYQCKTGCAWTTTPTPAGGSVISGILSFKLSKPTGGGTGSVDVSISAPNYLLAGSNGAAVNPSIAGRATFGVYKGNNEFIYLRELY